MLLLWAVTKRMKMQIHKAEMSFLCTVAGHREGVRSSDIREGLRVDPLLLDERLFHTCTVIQTSSGFYPENV